MSEVQQEKRQLTIKTGVVQRLAKELGVYRQEADEQAVRVKQYASQGKDEWDVKKQEEILRDCQQMVPDTSRRLAAAISDLESCMNGLSSDSKGTDAYSTAMSALEYAKAQSSSF
ncbi:hypothetical protein MGL_3200 [Malassezia globosa CBS 7966]|uniref:Tubulin-specific chaperone A n=1 Tax=Malassezia globosa (strain ATCC MYA-4612 / CBS 7966) TaxID=425265 RepID=A8Q845_MALGO|nr:uncharacterized protein MGL_3200 [Malassezia globosa CBS 7966]EDP42442.1 hypothetical protein MGL_3200 [Malassezia globosa CBS 7966]